MRREEIDVYWSSRFHGRCSCSKWVREGQKGERDAACRGNLQNLQSELSCSGRKRLDPVTEQIQPQQRCPL